MFLRAGNRVNANIVHANAGIGIDLAPDGPTPNDPGDSNGLQNFPEILSGTNAGSVTAIQGSLDSAPSTTFRIEFFSSAVCDASGNGEAERFLGSTNPTTDAAGRANFTVTVPTAVEPGWVVTSLATSPGGSTSELSTCRIVTCSAGTPNGSPSLSVEPEVLTWTVPASSSAYDLVRGDLVTLRSTGGDFIAATGQCLANDTPESSFPFTPAPAPGQGFWFLVRPVNCAGPGSYDTGVSSKSAHGTRRSRRRPCRVPDRETGIIAVCASDQPRRVEVLSG